MFLFLFLFLYAPSSGYKPHNTMTMSHTSDNSRDLGLNTWHTVDNLHIFSRVNE